MSFAPFTGDVDLTTLLLGAGTSRKKRVIHESTPDKEFVSLVTLDLSNADVNHDLNDLPYPFQDGEFDEIHAYEVLEHCGVQGDFRFFFAQFNELHRILVKNGVLVLSVPNYKSIWAFGDPGHTRVLPYTVFNYLQRSFYDQLGETACADYRDFIEGWWEGLGMEEQDDQVFVLLRAI